MQKPEKKIFTAELQRLKQKQGDLGAAIRQAAPAGGAADPQLLEMLNEMREDLKLIERYVRPEGAPDPHEAKEDVVPAGMLETKKAEVAMLKTELRALAVCIEQTKQEIAALRPQTADEDRIMAVTFELDAIVNSTERATHTILESAEKIDGLATQMQAQLKEHFASQMADEISEHVVTIFESCNFQDITGQRITKVVNTLKYIEERVNRMVNIWGAENLTDIELPAEIHHDEDKKLLNGPALENQGISQAEIDALFA